MSHCPTAVMANVNGETHFCLSSVFALSFAVMEFLFWWITLLLIASFCCACYLLPTIIAGARKHRQAGTIFVINLFFGLTIVGWVIALAWSVSDTRKAA